MRRTLARGAYSGRTIQFSFCLFLAFWNCAATGEVSTPELAHEFSIMRGKNIPKNATEGLGAWIWTDSAFDHQSCRFWRDFEIPDGTKVTSARMRMTADNGYRFYLDGRELGQGADWRGLTDYDLSLVLKPGHHVLAVDAFNDYFQAGLIMVLKIELSDGRSVEIKSDQNWRIVPNKPGWERIKHADPKWLHAVVIPTASVAEWSDGAWPFDYVTVPPIQPVTLLFWQTPWFHITLASVCGIAFLTCIALVFRLAVHSNEQRLLTLERARIARDIHDDFGTRLTHLVLEGELAKSEIAGNESARERLSRISDGLREALGAMDEVLWAVNPRRDTVKDFVTYICEYAQTFLQSTNIQCLLEVEPHMPPLSFDLPLRRSLLLAVKEAIANVAKHSQASKMVLRIYRNEPNLVVVVEDDGVGFESGQTTGERNGLSNIVQRMNEVGGFCTITSNPGMGCCLEFKMPLTRRHPRVWGWLRIKDGWYLKGNGHIAPQPATRVTEASLSNQK